MKKYLYLTMSFLAVYGVIVSGELDGAASN